MAVTLSEMPATMASCFGPLAVSTWPAMSAGMSECSARGSFPVSRFHASFRLRTLSFVRILSSRTHPVRCASPPSVAQSMSACVVGRCAANWCSATTTAPKTATPKSANRPVISQCSSGMPNE